MEFSEVIYSDDSVGAFCAIYAKVLVLDGGVQGAEKQPSTCHSLKARYSIAHFGVFFFFEFLLFFKKIFSYVRK